MQMQIISNSNSRIWFEPSLLSADPAQSFDPDYWQQQQAIIGSASGRGTTWFIRTPETDMALRHYRRGGLFGRLVADSYLFTGWDKTRCAEELHLLQLLAAGGVRVPRPVAARAVRHGLIYQADILVEKIPNAQDLVAVLQQRSLLPEEWRLVGCLIRKMHDLQVCHTDLNIHNILLDDQGQFWLIDFDKCYQSAGQKWKKGNLSRMLRSLHKEQAKRQIKWQTTEWESLCAGYNHQ